MQLDIEKVDEFLSKNSKKYLVAPNTLGMDRLAQSILLLLIYSMFLFLPYLAHSRYYYEDIYSKHQKPLLDKRRNRIQNILDENSTELGDDEEVFYAIISPTTFITFGILITQYRLIYKLRHDKGIFKNKGALKDPTETVLGVRNLSEMGAPLLSNKSYDEACNVKLGDDIIGALPEVGRPLLIEHFLSAVYRASRSQRNH